MPPRAPAEGSRLQTLHLRRPAMATVFELWVVGSDPEHLEAVGHAALDEVTRVERLLSRFDPAAEIARLNREAAEHPVRVDHELYSILEDCLRWRVETDGFFDLCAGSARAGAEGAPLEEPVVLDPGARTVRFADERVRIDMGGYGKGYALDCMLSVLERFGVGDALMHGGTSSVLARGARAEGVPWRVGVRDPFAENSRHLEELPLEGGGFSYSAALRDGAPSDIVDPHTGAPLPRQEAVIVLAPTAAEAEIYSTALLAMGRAAAEALLRRASPGPGFRAGWIDRDGEGVGLRWLTDHRRG